MSSISHSRADNYLLCRRKEYYGYGLELTRINESDSLAFGSAVHEVLEVFYGTILELGGKGKTKPVIARQKKAIAAARKAAFEKVDALYSKDFEDSERLPALRRTIERYLFEAEPFVGTHRVLAVEKKFNLQYDDENEDQFTFIIDLLLEDAEGYIVAVDHKTTYDFYDDDAIAIQGQIPKYIGALRALGYKVNYAIYNQLRSRPLNGTKMLKGEIIEALTTEGRSETDYDIDGPLSKLKVADLEELAINNGIKTRTEADKEDLFRMHDFRPSATRVVRTFEEQVMVAAEIRTRASMSIEDQERTAFRTANKMVCKSCPFRDLCESELAGLPVKMMMETEFKKKEKRDKVAVSKEIA